MKGGVRDYTECSSTGKSNYNFFSFSLHSLEIKVSWDVHTQSRVWISFFLQLQDEPLKKKKFKLKLMLWWGVCAKVRRVFRKWSQKTFMFDFSITSKINGILVSTLRRNFSVCLHTLDEDGVVRVNFLNYICKRRRESWVPKSWMKLCDSRSNKINRISFFFTLTRFQN